MAVEWVQSQLPNQHESWTLITNGSDILGRITCRQGWWTVVSPAVTQRLLAADLDSAQREAVRLIRAYAQEILDATAPATPREG